MPGTITDPEQGPPDVSLPTGWLISKSWDLSSWYMQLDNIAATDDERKTLSGGKGKTVGSRISKSQAAQGCKTNTANTRDAQRSASQHQLSHQHQSIPVCKENDQVKNDGCGRTRQSQSYGITQPKMDTVAQEPPTSDAHGSRKKRRFRRYHHQDKSPTGHPRICTGKWGYKRHPPNREDLSHRTSCLSLAAGLNRLLGFDQSATWQSYNHGQTK